MHVYISADLEARLNVIGKSVNEVLEEVLRDVPSPAPGPLYMPPKRLAILKYLPSAAPGVTLTQIQAACCVSRPTAVAAVAACREVQSAVMPHRPGHKGPPAVGYWLPAPVESPAPVATTTVEPKP